MIVIAWRTDGNQRYSWMKNRRSLFVNWTRPRTLRCSTISCCLSAAFSASSWLLGLKREAARFKSKTISAAIAVDVSDSVDKSKRTGFSVHTPLRGPDGALAKSDHAMFRSVTRAVRALCIVHCRCGHGRGAEHVGKLDHGIVARMSACEIRGRIPSKWRVFSFAPSGETPAVGRCGTLLGSRKHFQGRSRSTPLWPRFMPCTRISFASIRL